MAGVLRYTALWNAGGDASDYLTVSRAKGLKERTVIMRHALRNAILPVITVVALALPGLFGGAVLIESVFGYPGMGLIMLDATKTRDYPLLMGGVLVAAVAVLVASLVADIAYAIADPRIRYE